MNITPEMADAWRTLQDAARTIPRFVAPSALESKIVEAINILDDSDFMVPVEEAGRESETASRFCNCDDPATPPCVIKGHPLPAPDPAEWGDTTREDMARRQK